MHLKNDESPTDPKRVWFNTSLVDKATEWMREQRARVMRPTPEPARYREAAEAREAWAREHGCESFDMAMRIGLKNVERGATGGRASSSYQHVRRAVTVDLPPAELAARVGGYAPDEEWPL